VTQVSLREFRSYERLDVELSSGLVVLAGPNGVGKTNFLEACAMLLQGSSPRTSSELRCVRTGAAFFRVSGTVAGPGGLHQHAVTIEPGRGKRLERDGSAVRSASEYGAAAGAITFLPERLLVVRGAPARRRALLDRLVELVRPAAGKTMRDYAHAVSQRNALLRQARGGRDVRHALTPWNEQLERLGNELRHARARAIAELGPRLTARYEQLTTLPAAGVSVDLRGPDIARALAETEALERRRGSTMVGPHLDDVRLEQDGRDLRAYGSTGEQRAALLAWALASADLVRNHTGVQPVLLLDEPYAELDRDRRALLSAALLRLGQVLVTTTEPPAHLPAAAAAAAAQATVLRVSSGQVDGWASLENTNPYGP
jgi:DNA replication and repair protein RecF